MCKVVVIMSSYNGEKYIKDQIESILNQDQKEVILYIRDDGSTDNTTDIIRKYTKSGRVILDIGNNLGAKNSFMQAIKNAPQADYYALSDQDDLWDINKISVAIKMIKENECDKTPILYHSALKLADQDGKPYAMVGKYNNIGFLNGETRAVTGCTVVFNKELRNLLCIHLPNIFPMHDAWIHDVCLAVNGKVLYDNNSYIRYRQHGNNVVGGSKSVIGSIKRRLRYLKKMEKCQNSGMYKEILENYSDQMSQLNIERASKLCLYNKSFSNKIYVLVKGKYFKGRLWWKIEQWCLIILGRY